MKKQELTQELLKELLDYDPDTGVFTWRERPLSMFEKEHHGKTWNKRFANKEAGNINYGDKKITVIRIRINKRNYLLHVLAYFYINGFLPKGDIDCIDNDFTNIKFNNIRECTRSDTQYKRTKHQGKNKLIGASFIKSRNKYQSKIIVKGKKIFLGYFNTPEEAHAAYVNAKRQISPEFTML